MIRKYKYNIIIAILTILCSCGVNDNNMIDQARYETYESSEFFENGASARPEIKYTIAHEDEINDVPEKNTVEWIKYGQLQFNIKCAVCHGRDGYGKGPVVRQGYPSPPSYHIQRLREVSDQHIYNIISNGLGKMRPQDRWVDEQERWAIIDYIRVLQLSQYASVENLPEDVLSKLNQEEERPEKHE